MQKGLKYKIHNKAGRPKLILSISHVPLSNYSGVHGSSYFAISKAAAVPSCLQAPPLWGAGFGMALVQDGTCTGWHWYGMAWPQFSFSSARSRSALGAPAARLEETLVCWVKTTLLNHHYAVVLCLVWFMAKLSPPGLHEGVSF